jgi:SSS family solute:Na+ symporter
MTDISIYWVVLSVGIVATVYTMLGGIQAVIWSDLIQFLILVAGAIIAIGCVALRTGTGPMAWWQDLQTVGHDTASLFPTSITDRISIVGMVVHVFFWYVCTNGSDQVAIQRYLTTPSLSAARRSYLVSALADLALTLLLAVCGMALFSYFFRQPELFAQIFESGTLAEQADHVFPRFISTQLPSGVGGLVVAALFAAAMSSLDSGVNSMATVVTVDFYRRLNKNADPNNELIIAKVVTVVSGCLVTLVACLIAFDPDTLGRNIVEMTNNINAFAVGPLAGVMFAGMFIKRCSAPAVLVGGVAGMTVGLCISFSQRIFNMEEPISFVYTISVPCLSTMLVAFIISLVIPEKNPQRLRGLIWGYGEAGVQQAE